MLHVVVRTDKYWTPLKCFRNCMAHQIKKSCYNMFDKMKTMGTSKLSIFLAGSPASNYAALLTDKRSSRTRAKSYPRQVVPGFLTPKSYPFLPQCVYKRHMWVTLKLCSVLAGVNHLVAADCQVVNFNYLLCQLIPMPIRTLQVFISYSSNLINVIYLKHWKYNIHKF